MKRFGIAFAFVMGFTLGSVTLSASKQHQVDPSAFDGTKFAQRYGLDSQSDFKAVYENGQMFIVLREGLTLPDDPPVFDAPDTGKRDRLAVLRTDAKGRDLTLAEINEYIRLRDSI